MVPVLVLFGILVLIFLGDLRIHALETLIVLSLWSVAVVAGKREGNIQSLWLWAIGLRLVAMFISPTLSDDVFRYVWEGYLITEGGNPYWESPLDSSVEHWSKSLVNHPELTTIYPPMTQVIFALLSLFCDHVIGWKLFSVLCDVGILWLLIRQQGPSKWVWLYALFPLPILESASSAHMETWAILPLVASMMFPSMRAWLLWLGGMIKLLPFVLLPVTLRSWKKGLGMIVLIFLSISVFSLWDIPVGAKQYAQHWSFHASTFALLESLVDAPRPWVTVIGAMSVLYVFWKVRPFSMQVFWIVGTFVLLSPTVHPWYLMWVFPVAIWHRSVSWTGLCCAYPLWYVALTTWDDATQTWDPPMWPQIFSYTLFLGLLVWEWRSSQDERLI